MKQASQLLQRTVRFCCHHVLWLYPSSFRKQFQKQMSETFDELVQDAFAMGTWRGTMSVCRLIGHELLICIPSQHMHCMYELLQTGRLRHYWKGAVVGSTVAGVIFTPADPVSTLVVATFLVIVFWILTIIFRGNGSALASEVEV